MRILLQILGLLIIVCIGWNQPFCDVARMILPWAQIPPSRLSLIKAKARANPAPGPRKAPNSAPSNPLNAPRGH